MADGENAAGCCDSALAYNHCSVVKWRIFEEDVFDKSHVDVSMDFIAGLFVVGQWHFALNDYQGAGFCL